MKAAIIVSLEDPAGLNIKKQLLENFDFAKSSSSFGNDVFANSKTSIYTVNEETIYHENLDKEIDADVFVFATKHRSAAGVPSLTVHAPGNWGKAEMGGKESKLDVAAATMIKKGLKLLTTAVTEEKLKYDVIQEATHHGPFLEKPCMFIEVGSNENEYNDEKAGKVIATTIMKILESNDDVTTAVAIGGMHHTPNFKDIQLSTNIAIGHVCPKYRLSELNAEQLQQAIHKTWPKKAELVIVDWKGLGEHKEKVKQLLDESGVEWKKTRVLKNQNL